MKRTAILTSKKNVSVNDSSHVLAVERELLLSFRGIQSDRTSVAVVDLEHFGDDIHVALWLSRDIFDLRDGVDSVCVIAVVDEFRRDHDLIFRGEIVSTVEFVVGRVEDGEGLLFGGSHEGGRATLGDLGGILSRARDESRCEFGCRHERKVVLIDTVCQRCQFPIQEFKVGIGV